MSRSCLGEDGGGEVAGQRETGKSTEFGFFMGNGEEMKQKNQASGKA